MSIFANQDLLLENFRREYRLGRDHVKLAGDPAKAYALSGELYLADSGWLMLKVPNSIVRGLFDALDETGLELPLQSGGNLRAHISVMTKDEVSQIGADNITERGHHYRYTLGPIKTVDPTGWDGVSRVWYVTVDSPELRQLRKSYGLEPLSRGYDHHITIAVRKTKVLHDNDVSKAASSMVAVGMADDLVAMMLARRAAARRQQQPQQPVAPAPEPTPPPSKPLLDFGSIKSRIATAVSNFDLAPKVAASAAGIPDRSDYGDLSLLKPTQMIDLIVQIHKARRAGEHYDLRLGDPERGLFSWAVRKGMPGPGGKHLAVQQPLHSHEYGQFEGEIPAGYGAGTVTKHRQGQVLVTKTKPDEIHFTTAEGRYPERYLLKKTNDRNWLLINTTKTEAIPHEKVHYTSVPADQAESILSNLQPGSSVQAKVDGAASLTKLYKDHLEVVSYRAAKNTGHPITHTERVFHGRPEVDIPKNMQGAVLRGELYGVNPQGQAIRPQALGGLLNSGIAKSIADQKSRGTELKQLVFDIDRPELPYRERLDLVRKILPSLPSQFHAPEEAKTPEEALSLWERIRSGQHPLTREGVVIHPLNGKPSKIKLHDEHDVHVREFFPGQGKYLNRGVGGFRYSFEPEGPIAGEVGSGLSDELREQMHTDPTSFLGRVARVRAQEKFPSGALRAPSLLSLHEDLPLAKAAGVKKAPMRLPVDMPSSVHLSLRGGDQTICPRCNTPILHDLYKDKKGWSFHRSCFSKGQGPIKNAKDKSKRQPIIAIDLDGTLTRPGKFLGLKHFHPLRKGVKKGMDELRRRGYKIIINTCRGNTKSIKAMLDKHGLPYDAINENIVDKPGLISKVFADVYLDDKGIDALSVGWDSIPDLIEKKLKSLER